MRKRTIYLVLTAALVVAGVSGCTASNTAAPPSTEPAAVSSPQGTPSGDVSPGKTADVTELKVEDTAVGQGAAAKAGDRVSVDYTGWLTDGTKFDSSKDAGTPFQFTLGAGEVIPGWDQGVAGMQVGGVRMLTIPPAMGYGAQGAGASIPPNATLVFKVELKKIN